MNPALEALHGKINAKITLYEKHEQEVCKDLGYPQDNTTPGQVYYPFRTATDRLRNALTKAGMLADPYWIDSLNQSFKQEGYDDPESIANEFFDLFCDNLDKELDKDSDSYRPTDEAHSIIQYIKEKCLGNNILVKQFINAIENLQLTSGIFLSKAREVRVEIDRRHDLEASFAKQQRQYKKLYSLLASSQQNVSDSAKIVPQEGGGSSSGIGVDATPPPHSAGSSSSMFSATSPNEKNKDPEQTNSLAL